MAYSKAGEELVKLEIQNSYHTLFIINDIKQKSTIYKTHLKNHLQIVENHIKTINNISFTNKQNHEKNKQHFENIY